MVNRNSRLIGCLALGCLCAMVLICSLYGQTHEGGASAAPESKDGKVTLRPRKLLAPTTIDIFLGRIEIALSERDREHFMELFSWKDAPANARTSAEKVFADLTAPTRKDADIEVGKLPYGYRLSSVLGGYRYEPNIKPEGVVKISFPVVENGKASDKMELFTLPFGLENGEYRLVTIKQTKLAWSGPPDKTLNIAVLQCGVTDKLRIRGFYIYNVSGVSVREEFDSVGGYSISLKGQFVEQCWARIESGKGAIRMVIREGGEDVFESEEHNASSSLVYKKSVPSE